MKIINNGDKELMYSYKCVQEKDPWVGSPCMVDIKLSVGGACVSWHRGGIVPFNHEINVKRDICTFFGLRKVKSFEERVQFAVDKMQRFCDRENAIILENSKMKPAPRTRDDLPETPKRPPGYNKTFN